MFNFLKGKKKELIVTLDRTNGIYYSGETVGVIVEIQPDKGLKLRSAQVELRGIEEYRFSSDSSYTDSEGNTKEGESTQWGYGNLFVSAESFLGEVTLPGGAPQRYTFQMPLPPDALPSFNGEILHVQWRVSVKLDRHLARDLNVEVAVCVASRAPGLAMHPGEYGASDDPGEAELSFTLPGLEVVTGQTLRGQLHILPRQNFSGKVRLELVRYESVSYDRGLSREISVPFDLAGNTDFMAGQPQVIPFEVSLPPDAAPSIQTPNGAIRWTIKGILSRSSHKAITVEQPVEVYTAIK